VFDPNSVGAGTVVERYAANTATDPGKYGYQVQAAGLAGRPAAVDTPYGSGHVVALGYNPFYRAWKEEDERLVLNAVLYPKGAALAPSEPTPATAQPAPELSAVKAATPALSAKQLRAPDRVAAVRVKHATSDRDVRIEVKRKDGAKLKAAVKAAKLSKQLRHKARYVTTKRTVTFVVKGARTQNEHARRAWVGRLRHALDKRRVDPIYALV
jgi:hypothetical protein